MNEVCRNHSGRLRGPPASPPYCDTTWSRLSTQAWHLSTAVTRSGRHPSPPVVLRPWVPAGGGRAVSGRAGCECRHLPGPVLDGEV